MRWLDCRQSAPEKTLSNSRGPALFEQIYKLSKQFRWISGSFPCFFLDIVKSVDIFSSSDQLISSQSFEISLQCLPTLLLLDLSCSARVLLTVIGLHFPSSGFVGWSSRWLLLSAFLSDSVNFDCVFGFVLLDKLRLLKLQTREMGRTDGPMVFLFLHADVNQISYRFRRIQISRRLGRLYTLYRGVSL